MSADSKLLVDIVIAVHDAARPVERAVLSVLDGESACPIWLRVTVVCHNIRQEEIIGAMSPAVAREIRFMELFDGVPSPSGPFGYGLAESDARYVSIMGSDDYLEPGALRAWLARAERDDLTAIIPPQRHASGSIIRTPPVRVFPRRFRDAVKDRLSYRTAPLGLIRRDAIERLGLHFTPEISTGEDQLFSAMLWFSGERVGYAKNAPRYVVGDDARQRVTFTDRSIAEDLRFIDTLLKDRWFTERDVHERRAIATKLVRVHVFASVSRRCENNSWRAADRGDLQKLLQLLKAHCAGFDRPLAIADRRLLDALRDADAPTESLAAFARKRRRFGHPATVITRDVRGMFAVEGPLRLMLASTRL